MEESRKELSLGKVTAKFTIKFILWTILFFVIGAIIVGVTKSEELDYVTSQDNFKLMSQTVREVVLGLLVVDILAALLATLLSVKGITKKTTITSENKSLILKRISIVVLIITVIVLAIHFSIIKFLDNMILESADTTEKSLSKAIEELEENADDLDIEKGDSEEFDESIEGLKEIAKSGKIYSFSGIVFLLAIPVAGAVLNKKIEK